MAQNDKFICLNCGHLDEGTYCSACREPLQIPERKMASLLAKRLVSECIYVHLKVNKVKGFPYDELRGTFLLTSEKAEKLLAFEGILLGFRTIKVVAMFRADRHNPEDILRIKEEAVRSINASFKKNVFRDTLTFSMVIYLFISRWQSRTIFETDSKGIASASNMHSSRYRCL